MKLKVILAACLCTVSPQFVQANFSDLFCDETLRLQEQLEKVVGAQPQGRGLRDPDAMIEIWIVPSSGDWTIVQSYANGTSCVVAMGEYWEDFLPEPA